MTRPVIQLIVDHNTLYLPCAVDETFAPDGRTMLMAIYCAGDCDTCPWPMPEDRQPKLNRRLARAIFDSVETGHIPHDHGGFDIALPDGAAFNYLDHLRAGDVDHARETIQEFLAAGL